MLKPKVGKTYQFVRVEDGIVVERTEYIRYYDGSSGFDSGGFHWSYDNNPDAWVLALRELTHLGFLEEREAKAQGLLL